jgi:predicted DNA-binding transcriptional regulator AlpA
MTREELLALPPAVDLPTAASVLGMSRSAAYELVRTGTWPTPVLRLGKLIRVPTVHLLALLGYDDRDPTPATGRPIVAGSR